MSIRYRCLILDHDDTTVMSTPLIHYPSHVETLRRLRPGAVPIDLEGWFRKNFHPGIMGYLVGELGMNPREIEEEYRIWREFTAGRVPDFFPGMLDTLAEFRRLGGLVVVVSHSDVDIIERDYRRAAGGSETGFHPDFVFGWTMDEEKRKPHPYPILSTQEKFGLERRELLVLDDLKPGADMAAAAGVDCAAAGWGHSIPELREAMQAACRWYFESVEDFRKFILS